MSVSVLVPTHDRPSLLPRALASLERQSFLDWRAIVVVNNADGMIRQEYVEILGNVLGDSRYDVVFRATAGLGAALNVGLHLTNGEYLAVLEDDDEWDPGFLETLARELSSFEGPLVYGDQREVFRGKIVNWVVPPPPERQDYAHLYSGNWIAFPMVLAKRSELLKIGGFDGSCGGATDWDTWLRLSARGPFRHVRQTLLTHHWNDERSNYCLDKAAMAEANARIAAKRAAGAYRHP